MFLKRLIRTTSPLLLLCLAIGCQGTSATPAASTMTPQKAVAINTGNGATYVLIPSSDGTGVARLAAEGAPACKQCEEDAEAYFKGGAIAAKCPVCGATRVPLHSVN